MCCLQFRGNTQIINCLLNNGADVNRLNDDGVSALVISFFSLYPLSVFSDTSRSRSVSSHRPLRGRLAELGFLFVALVVGDGGPFEKWGSKFVGSDPRRAFHLGL